MRVWVDIENAPQAWFFRPLLPALRARGAETVVTVRDYGEAVALLKAAGEPYAIVGGVRGDTRLARSAAVLTRTAALVTYARGRKIDVAMSHGVRSHLAAAAVLRIPCVTGYDYEHASKLMVHRLASEVLMPRVLLDHLRARGGDVARVTGYDGLKEEIYLHELRPDPAIYAALGLDPVRPIVTLRPPSFHAHYASEAGNELFFEVLAALRRDRAAQVVVTARDRGQRDAVINVCREDRRVRVPERPVDGLNLVWHSDLVISGGGTMAREAALLGVPSASIFRGELGAVEASLESDGRLRRISRAAEIDQLPLTRSRDDRIPPPARLDLVDFIVERILSHG